MCTLQQKHLSYTGVLVTLLSVVAFSSCLPLPIPVGPRQLSDAVLGSDNRVHVLYTVENQLRYGVIHRGQILFEPIDNDISLSFVDRYALALDPGGNPHAVYTKHQDNEQQLVHAWKESGAWQSEIIERSDYATGTSMAIGKSGDVHVSYAVHVDTGVEFHYAVRHEGVWTLEIADTMDTDYAPWPLSRIALTPDQNPVVVGTTGGNWVLIGDSGGSRPGVVHMSQRMTGGGWNAEEIFHQEAAGDISEGVAIFNLSLTISPLGSRAVSFDVAEVFANRLGTALDYHILEDSGSGWEEVFLGTGVCGWGDPGCPFDYQSQDIAYDQSSTLYALFTREERHPVPPYDLFDVLQTTALARKTAGGWEEKTIWPGAFGDITLGRNWGYVDSQYSLVRLLLNDSPQVKTVYNGYFANQPYMMFMDFFPMW